MSPSSLTAAWTRRQAGLTVASAATSAAFANAPLVETTDLGGCAFVHVSDDDEAWSWARTISVPVGWLQ